MNPPSNNDEGPDPTVTERQDHGEPWIDHQRTIKLDMSGLPGYLASVVIDVDGEEVLVLVREASLGTSAQAYPADWRDVAPHERTGRLQGDLAPRCGRTATTEHFNGRVTTGVCRRHVAVQGDTCEHHADIADQSPEFGWPYKLTKNTKEARR